jgi:tRNA-specific 2-thiouridylase
MSKKKVMIGMSGGVDSSVAAALLLEQGHEVVGVTLKLWAEESDDMVRPGGGCCSLDDINDARMVAFKLGIPHYVLNFKEAFRKDVVDYFAREYQEGRTPNPCIACNRRIKFEGLMDKALAMGFDFIATGHYAKIVTNPASSRFELHQGSFAPKDQSYVLYHFTQQQLSHMLMPVGDLSKDQTREIAARYGLAIAKKPDSQEICFVPDHDYAAFIERYTGKPSAPGDFIDTKGRILGTHPGIGHFTVGQRKGLGITFGVPMFVVNISAKDNTVTLGTEEETFRTTLTAGDLNFIEIPELAEPLAVTAKIRYSAVPAPAVISPVPGGKAQVVFEQPQKAITPGQAVVFYHGGSVVGGGTILE